MANDMNINITNRLLLKEKIKAIIINKIIFHPNKTIIMMISWIKFKEKRKEKFEEHDKNHQIIMANISLI